MSIVSYCLPSRYQLSVLARFMLAVVGGYILTAVTSTTLMLILPMNPVDAVLLSTTLSILFYASYFLYVFSTDKLKTPFAVFFVLSLLQLSVIGLYRDII